MKIVCDPDGGRLERLRPSGQPEWLFVASGYWSASPMHSGYIEYFLAKSGIGEWLLDGVVRNGCLDDLSQEDVDAGGLDDHQLQALWGTTLERAQAQESREIVAHVRDVPEHTAPELVATLLYDAVVAAGGRLIGEGGRSGLVDP